MARRRIPGAALIAAALFILIGALAFQTAVVTNPTSFVVDATGNAALAMSPGTAPDPGVSVSVVGRRLSIVINDKMQPGSTYTFSDVFRISNVGPAGGGPYPSVRLGYATSGGWPPEVALAIFKTGTTQDLATITLDNTTATSVEVDLRLSVDASYAGTGGTFGIDITGSR